MPIRFQLNGRPVEVDGVAPTTTLLEWLRSTGATGSKEGCAEGDCGACSVAVLDRSARGGPSWRSVDACLIPLPQMQGEDVVTVEGLAQGALHPAQRALVDVLGSQCGYCTPGFAVALFEATYRQDLDSSARRDDQISGNLCRCTGYRPIREELDRVAGTCPRDAFHPEDRPPTHVGHGSHYAHGANSRS